MHTYAYMHTYVYAYKKLGRGSIPTHISLINSLIFLILTGVGGSPWRLLYIMGACVDCGGVVAGRIFFYLVCMAVYMDRVAGRGFAVYIMAGRITGAGRTFLDFFGLFLLKVLDRV